MSRQCIFRLISWMFTECFVSLQRFVTNETAMLQRNGHINSVKDTKIVALTFGGLRNYFTDRQTDRQTDRLVLNNQKERVAALPEPRGTGGAAATCMYIT